MSFLISIPPGKPALVLTDLGGFTIAELEVNYNLENDFLIDDLLNSDVIAAAIDSYSCTVTINSTPITAGIQLRPHLLRTGIKPMLGNLDMNGFDIINWPGAGGGVGSFSSLTDVNFTSLTNGQTIEYDSGSGKWINVNSGSTPYTNGAGLDLVGSTFSVSLLGITNAMLAGSIAASKLIGIDIVTVGTITSGIWHGSPITDTYISSAATWNSKQAALISGTNIKTINTNSLLGAGDISVTTLIGYIPTPSTRNITINGTTYDLSADRTWTITSSVFPLADVLAVGSTTDNILITSNDLSSKFMLGDNGYTYFNTSDSLGTDYGCNLYFSPESADGIGFSYINLITGHTSFLNINSTSIVFESANYNFSTSTASTIAGFDSSSNLIGLDTTTYPSLLELINVKGTTSSIQTQLNSLSGTFGSYLPLSGGTMIGDILLSLSHGIDTTATGGTDTLNIGANNADVINIGRVGAIINFLGSALYEYQANQYVLDKLITINYNGSAGSGSGAGFEIEEGGSITGYFKTNGTRNGYDILTPAISFKASLILSSLLADRIFTLPDATGTIALLSDIPSVGTWGSLNYPTWVSGTPFVKMTGSGTFTLDTNTYLTTISGLNISLLSNDSGYITSAALSSYIPYTGASSNVDLGTYTIKTPTIIGGSTTTSSLTHQTTTGVGTTGADHIFVVGNNGATEAMRILNSGLIGINNSSPTYQLDISPVLGSELAPALTGSSGTNWTLSVTTGYTQPFAGTIDKTGDGTGTITTTAATSIIAGITYKVVIVVSAISGSTATYTIGGLAGTALTAATTYTDYITANTTGKLIITPVATALRITITSISIKAVSYGGIRSQGVVSIGNLGIGTRQLRVSQDSSYLDFGSWVGQPTYAAIYANQTTPTSANYILAANVNVTALNGNNQLSFYSANVAQVTINRAANNIIFSVTPSSVPLNTASVELPVFKVASATKTFNAGALTTQRFNYLQTQTLAFASASTATNVYGLYVEAATVGTNATITNNYALGLLGNLDISDYNIKTGSTTGTIFGLTGDKLAFLGATPIVRPSGDVVTALSNLGLITTPTLNVSASVTGVLPPANGGMDPSMYVTLMQALGYLNSGNTPGTYYLITANNAVNTCSSGASNIIAPQVIYINSADYPTINGLAPKLRIRVNLMTNATNTTGTWTFGLFPITAGAGAVGFVSHTIGTVVAGSNGASQVNPLASQVYNLVSSDFALPANGLYAICVTNTAIATNATIQFNAQLQIHNA